VHTRTIKKHPHHESKEAPPMGAKTLREREQSGRAEGSGGGWRRRSVRGGGVGSGVARRDKAAPPPSSLTHTTKPESERERDTSFILRVRERESVPPRISPPLRRERPSTPRAKKSFTRDAEFSAPTVARTPAASFG
jgi:hypothetical protein